jgi:single-stranded-DNA-specific exonuclease
MTVKYKLKNNPIQPFSFDYLSDYLIALGIKNPNSFINQPSEEDEEHYSNLDNIDEAITMLYDGFINKKKFFLQVDSDADGYTSSAIFYAFFKKVFPESNIEFRLHDEKEHGVILDTIPIDADIIVIPDAGSMQIDEQEAISRSGRKLVILDHHKIENYNKFENVVIVNNQFSSNFKNKFLSGAGVVYKTIQAFCDKYLDGEKLYEFYSDLAAVGIISDMMDTREPDNNYIIRKGLSNIQNPMLQSLLEKQSYSISNTLNPTKIDIAFYISPIINGVIRFGTEEEKINLFSGLMTYDSTKMMNTVYHGNQRSEHFYDYIARVSYNVKERQNREKLKALKILTEEIESNNLQDNQILAVIVSKDDVPQTITGLVAMELLKKYKKPTLVLRPRNDNGVSTYAGSGRGKANGDFDSLFWFLRDSGLCEYVEGHDMAHGVSVKVENFDKLIEYANNHLSHIEFDVEEAEVDYIFTNGDLNREMLAQFGDNLHLYGNGIPQPKFAFELRLSKENFKLIGKNSDTVKMSINGIDFIKFKDKGLADVVNAGDMFEMVIIGRAQINEWMGKKTPQIVIDSYDIKPITLEALF